MLSIVLVAEDTTNEMVSIINVPWNLGKQVSSPFWLFFCICKRKGVAF